MLEDVMARHSPTELHALSVRLQALGAQLFDGAEDRKNELEGGDAIDPRWADSMQQGFVCQARRCGAACPCMPVLPLLLDASADTCFFVFPPRSVALVQRRHVRPTPSCYTVSCPPLLARPC